MRLVKKYHLHTKMWWAKANPLEKNVIEDIYIMIERFYGKTKSTEYGFSIKIYKFNSTAREKPCARIEIFDDAFDVFDDLPALFTSLAKKKDLSTQDVVKILDGLGFQDTTEEENPDDRTTRRDSGPQVTSERASGKDSSTV